MIPSAGFHDRPLWLSARLRALIDLEANVTSHKRGFLIWPVFSVGEVRCQLTLRKKFPLAANRFGNVSRSGTIKSGRNLKPT